jgi:MFS transporter, FHS family, glucose/mannose:H+ symporter
MALLGAILPAWGYHLNFAFSTVGNYFLALAAGLALSTNLTRHLARWKGVRASLITACLIACIALLFLGFASPPAPASWRVAGLLFVGLAAGMLNTSLFLVIRDTYQHNPSGTLSLGGALFGSGSLIVTMLVAGTFYAYSINAILVMAALIPALFAVQYARAPVALDSTGPVFQESPADLKRPGSILLALLLFFQFGNEWSVAGWLSVYLASRLGISPASALAMLAFYWVALLVGRIAAVAVLPRFSHSRLLLGGAGAAVFGCLVLLQTDNRFGAYTALFLIGTGFAPIYPLVAEKIGHRFHSYHPGLFNGMFSVAVIGAMIAPAISGYLAEFYGMGMIMAIPMVGTVTVLILVLMIWLESKLGE